MAFLDNSGDIILDAVLTDLGRKRMAEGTFSISSFALGDDEIDYRTYDKNHPSGSAYYDLQILQTPVLEAFASSNANINYGLASFNSNLNLLYLPTIKVWGSPKSVATSGRPIHRTTGSVYYISANSDTDVALNNVFSNPALGGAEGDGGFYYSGTSNVIAILLETGIDSPTGDPPRTADLGNKLRLINGNGLADANFDVFCDHRMISTVLSAQNITWQVPVTGDGISAHIGNLVGAGTGLSAAEFGVANYKKKTVPAHATAIRQTSDPGKVTPYTAINGPSGQMTAISFTPHANLIGGAGSADYANYGKTGQDVFGDGNTYDYIDTAVYVVGKTTGVTAHLPIRIIRKVIS